MAVMGRPKADNPYGHKVTVKLREEEYQLAVEFAKSHDISISQLLREGMYLRMEKEHTTE